MKEITNHYDSEISSEIESELHDIYDSLEYIKDYGIYIYENVEQVNKCYQDILIKLKEINENFDFIKDNIVKCYEY